MGDSNPKVFNNIIMLNKGLYGPGVVLNYSGGTFKNNIVIQNSGATSFGGGGALSDRGYGADSTPGRAHDGPVAGTVGGVKINR